MKRALLSARSWLRSWASVRIPCAAPIGREKLLGRKSRASSDLIWGRSFERWRSEPRLCRIVSVPSGARPPGRPAARTAETPPFGKTGACIAEE